MVFQTLASLLQWNLVAWVRQSTFLKHPFKASLKSFPMIYITNFFFLYIFYLKTQTCWVTKAKLIFSRYLLFVNFPCFFYHATISRFSLGHINELMKMTSSKSYRVFHEYHVALTNTKTKELSLKSSLFFLKAIIFR